ncbi:MAG: hypothetical protein ACI4WX_16275 [Aristaeellaceae bacterium]
MRKPMLSLLLLGGTLLCTWMMAAHRLPEKPAKARFAVVERGDVHQVLALEGRLTYAAQQVVVAKTSGTVTQVCVESGQRIAAGEALIRLDGSPREQLAAALAAQNEWMPEAIPTQTVEEMLSAYPRVIRAEEAYTVRQVYVGEDALVTMGMPVALVSSNWQEIVCQASANDAASLSPGMWAWLSAEGASLGTALVESVGERQADSITGVTFATVSLRPEQHIDLPEQTAIDVDVYFAGSDDVLSLPLEAITERDTVWWVSDGRCTEIPAQIVMADEMRAWVELPEGITVALGEFTEGQRVTEADE